MIYIERVNEPRNEAGGVSILQSNRLELSRDCLELDWLDHEIKQVYYRGHGYQGSTVFLDALINATATGSGWKARLRDE